MNCDIHGKVKKEKGRCSICLYTDRMVEKWGKRFYDYSKYYWEKDTDNISIHCIEHGYKNRVSMVDHRRGLMKGHCKKCYKMIPKRRSQMKWGNRDYYDLDFTGKNEREYFQPKVAELFGDRVVFQRKFPNLPYVVDAFVEDLKLVIEYDEDYHDAQQEKDMKRQSILEDTLGVSVCRIPDREFMKNPDSLCDTIQSFVMFG